MDCMELQIWNTDTFFLYYCSWGFSSDAGELVSYSIMTTTELIVNVDTCW